MDVWVNFTNATKWQAEGIFKSFFPSTPAASSSHEASYSDASLKDLRWSGSGHAVPILEEAEVGRLAKHFADAIPEQEISVRPIFPPSHCVCPYAAGFCRSLAYRDICSRIRRAHENASRRWPNGAGK
jgi:hypothetical protein